MKTQWPRPLGWRGKLFSRLDPHCTRCPLSKLQGGTHVCVAPTYDSGSYPRIVLIGEAPGSAEAQTGESFRGASGRWMREHLRKLDMEQHVYITNVVKCRPPDNRTPDIHEINTCAERFLFFELKILNPKVILTLGSTARIALGFLERKEYPNSRKFFCTHKWFESYVGITWHPAYCLRNGSVTQTQFVEMLKWAKQFVRP